MYLLEEGKVVLKSMFNFFLRHNFNNHLVIMLVFLGSKKSITIPYELLAIAAWSLQDQIVVSYR